MDGNNIPEFSASAIGAILCTMAAQRDLNATTLRASLGVSAGIWLFAAGFHSMGRPLEAALPLAVLSVACLLIAEIDRRHRLIPDLLTAAIALLGLTAPFAPIWQEKALGCLLLAGLFLGIRWSFARAGKDEALGLGDVKLAGAIGIVVGLSDGLMTVGVSAAATALVALAVQAARRSSATPPPTPFGIALAAGLCIVSAMRA